MIKTTFKLCFLVAVVVTLILVTVVDALEFTTTNLELYRPVVIGETVTIDCATNEKNVNLNLLQLKKGTDQPIILQADGQRLVKVNQTFSVFVSGNESTGEYICDADVGSERVQKSLHVYIAGKVSGDIPKPEVLVKPDSTVNEGTKLEIECKTQGTFAKLSWEKEGRQVADSLVTNKKPYFKEGTVIVESILTINDVKLENAGLYTCKSVSRFDQSKSAKAGSIINVRGRLLKWIKDNPQLMNAVQTRLGSPIIISCAMTHPAKKVTFYNKSESDGGKLSPLALTNGTKYQLLNLQELVIYDVQNSDDGVYVCRAENNLLQDKEIKIFINQFAAQAPYAIVSPKFLDLDFNSADNVTCTTFGNNNQVEWLRAVQINGQTKLEKVPTENILATFTLTPQGNYKREWTLMFRNVTESDAGSYMCKVTSDTKPTFREVDVAVKPAQAPQIRKFSAQVTKENSRTSLNCRSNGAPSPKIQFFKDGVEIMSGTKGYVIKGRKLLIEKPKFPDHDGLYTCYVTNMFGKATRQANLTVTVAPIINKSQRIVVVGSEDKLRITCNITRSNPVPRITWQYQPWSCPPSRGYDCDPVPNKWETADPANFDIRPPTAVAMQSVFKVPKSSVQRFFVQCIAEHNYGKDTHKVIGIIDKRDPNSLLRSSPGFQTNERESFKLECSGAAGFFLNLTWKKDDLPIQLAPNRVTIKKSGSILEDQQIILNVRNSTPADSGFYECIGTPARAKDSPVVVGTEVVINKIYPPAIIDFDSSVVNNNENAIIKCSVDSHPTAKVTWFKDGKPLVVESIGTIEDCVNREKGNYFQLVDEDKNGGQNFVQTVKPKHHKLVICKTQWKKNNGSYSCRAQNNLGVARKDSTILVFAPPKMLYPQHDEYPSPEKGFSRNCTSEGNPLPYVWWEKEKNGQFVVVSKNSTTGVSYLTVKTFDGSHYGKYRCVAQNELKRMEDTMTLKKPVLIVGGYGSNNNVQQTASLVAALVAAVLIIIILIVLAIILYKRKRLYGGFYILSIPPSPDYFNKLDPTRPISDQINKLPYFPEWEYPRNKIKLKNCVGAGAFGEVYIADAIGICAFDPRYKISAKHKPLLGKKRFSLSKSKTLLREDSVASSRSSRSTKSLVSKSGGGDKNALVAVKKLKDDASTSDYKDLISELKILIHIGQNKHIVNLLAACTKGVEKDSMVVLEYCPHGNLLSFIKSRRQMFKPIWSKQHLGMEKEFTMFDLCVAGYQIAKGLEFLAARKCVHRDVAARNVLVGENYVMKIADFGLARDVYKEESYIKVSGGLLPIKWMAIESILDRVFTHASDVWSYGVLMWEVMTLGSAPYPSIPARELPEFLSNGSRMDQPPRCPNEVFQLIVETWNELPSHRPTFKDIVLRLARVVEAHCNPQDVPHYLDKEHVSGNSLSYEDQDYLRPVESDIGGSYKFTSSSSYTSSLGRNDDVFRHRNDSSNQNERYVPDNRFKENEVTERLLGDFDNKKDVSDGISDKSIEHKSKMEEMVSEKDFKKHDKINNNNKNPYQNDDDTVTKKGKNKRNKEEVELEMESEKDIDEREGLMSEENGRTPSVVEELSSFIDDQYEQMDRTDGYVNS